MKNCRKVLIAVNGSLEVLTKGLQLAEEEKCEVTVVKVVPSYEGDLSLVGVKHIKNVLDGETEKAISTIKEVAEAEGATVKVRLEEGDIDEKIAEVAEEENSDLIIMGANRKSSLKDLLLGNLAGKVTSQTDRPVYLVKS
jgi:nucleotide-binding universal stress UspA family protein